MSMKYFLVLTISSLFFSIIAMFPPSATAATHEDAVPSPNCVSVGNQPCSHTVSPSPAGSNNSVSPGSTSPGSPSNTQTISGTPSSTTTTSPSPSTTPCSTSKASISSQSTNSVHAFARGGKKHFSGRMGFLQQFFLFFWQLLQLIFQKLGIQLPNLTIPCGSGSGSNPSPSGSPSTGGTPSSAPSAAAGGNGGTSPSSAPSTAAKPSSSAPSAAPSSGGSSSSMQPVGVSGSWTLAFDDEFNGTSLNANNWAAVADGGESMENNVQVSASNVSVSGGDLILTLSSSSLGANVTSDP